MPRLDPIAIPLALALCGASTGLAAPSGDNARARASGPEEAAPPLPPRRPADIDRTGTTSSGASKPDPAAAEARAASRPAETAAETDPACLDRLRALHVAFETRPSLKDGACGAAAPVTVSRLPNGVAVTPAATMTCPLAEALARWTVEVLTPEADRHLGAGPTKLSIGTAYECRNQRSGTKLSEHAFANGVDVMGVELWKRPAVTITFHKEGTEEAAYQNAIRARACAYFTTVLGPGSDEAHADHLHLDLRGRKAGYRICQ